MHYILSREKIEHFASEVLKEYNAEYLEIPQAIDVYDFMENFMGLETDYKNLSPDESVLGLTAFNDGIYMVWNEDRTKQYPIEVKDGTVILENSLLESGHDGRERFTVMHECSHQILHRECFKRAIELSKDGLVTCAKRDIEPTRKRLVTSRDWIEWQANALAAAMLMPLEMVKQVFFEMMEVTPKTSKLPYGLTLGIDLMIFDMSDVFQVSHKAMKIRLQQLGLVKDRVYDFDEEVDIVM